MRRMAMLASLCACALAAPGMSEAELAQHKVGEFASPTYLTAPPEDRERKFITERAGRIRVVLEGRKLGHPFLDIRDKVSTGGENGLLSMAFSPDYARHGRFYVYYVDNGSDIRVDQFRAFKANRARESSRTKIIEISSPPQTHKGGQVQMTESGWLLLATGDGGDFSNTPHKAQDPKSLLGKVLRIKPDPRPGDRNYRPHPDNPYVGRGDDGHSAIMARGLRNPWRFSLDRKRPSRITIADVGHSRLEEVNSGGIGNLAGANFGWPCYEGTLRLQSCHVSNHRRPNLTYRHGDGSCSVTGGYFNRAPGIPRQGKYLFGDYCSGRIWASGLGSSHKERTPINVSGLVSFGEDAKGNLYTVSINGPVRRLVDR